jgi:serine/threonine protein kinase
MAPQPSSHNFQKLKLDTSGPTKRVASTFDSIPRRDSTHQNAHAHPQHNDLPVAEPHDFTNGSFKTRHQNGSHGHIVAYDAGPLAVGSPGSADDDLEALFRRRKMSISFDNEVKLDTGDRLGLEVRVPKPAPRHSHSYTPDDDGSYSDNEYLEMPFHQRRPVQLPRNQARYPLLQTTVDDLANDPEYADQVASLTSEATASPLEELRTPLETPSSLSEFPLFSPLRSGPTRNRSFRSEIGEDGSLRKTSRRSSNRSGRSLSSMSPAASFLQRYKASEAPIKASEPDDEGQGIGYDSEYIIGKQIGYGGFSVVKEVTSMDANGKPVVDAVKIVRKQQLNKSEFENDQIQTQFDHEVEIWRFLRHPYILPLLRVYTTDFATFCIIKLNKGGTLFDLVRETRRKKENGLPKHLVKRYAYQLASAIRYLHNDVQVVHRDVKLENCLIDMTVPNAERDGGDILVCDFGMADFIISDQRDSPEPNAPGENHNIGPAGTSTSVAGSLQYAAPELFDASASVFSPAADIWAFGVVLYALLTANLPFNGGLDVKTTANIQQGEWDEGLLSSALAVQDGGLEDVLTLLRGCLDMDPEKRWTIRDVLECAWLRDCEKQYEDVPRPWLANC